MFINGNKQTFSRICCGLKVSKTPYPVSFMFIITSTFSIFNFSFLILITEIHFSSVVDYLQNFLKKSTNNFHSTQSPSKDFNLIDTKINENIKFEGDLSKTNNYLNENKNVDLIKNELEESDDMATRLASQRNFIAITSSSSQTDNSQETIMTSPSSSNGEIVTASNGTNGLTTQNGLQIQHVIPQVNLINTLSLN